MTASKFKMYRPARTKKYGEAEEFRQPRLVCSGLRWHVTKLRYVPTYLTLSSVKYLLYRTPLLEEMGVHDQIHSSGVVNLAERL